MLSSSHLISGLLLIATVFLFLSSFYSSVYSPFLPFCLIAHLCLYLLFPPLGYLSSVIYFFMILFLPLTFSYPFVYSLSLSDQSPVLSPFSVMFSIISHCFFFLSLFCLPVAILTFLPFRLINHLHNIHLCCLPSHLVTCPLARPFTYAATRGLIPTHT